MASCFWWQLLTIDVSSAAALCICVVWIDPDFGDHMPNEHILARISGLQATLMALYSGGATLSSAVKGGEREYFINKFLGPMFPPPFRFGTGDITDSAGTKSGQVDVVVEYPFLPSLPMMGSGPRLYLAEGVAAVIEVKSNLASQWDEVVLTATKVNALHRKFGTTSSMVSSPSGTIPLFVVGYKGWGQMDTLQKHMSSCPVDGILIIESELFISNVKKMSMQATDSWALWGFISCLHHVMSTLKTTSASPIIYSQ